MEVKVLFFARSRELAGAPEAAVPLPAGATTASLLAQLLERYPALAEIQGAFVLSLNQEYLAPGQVRGGGGWGACGSLCLGSLLGGAGASAAQASAVCSLPLATARKSVPIGMEAAA